VTADRFQTVLVGALAGLGFAAGASIVASAPQGVRAPAVLVAALLCPGWSVVGWFRHVPPALSWASAIALSCAVNILVSLALVTVDVWYPRAAVTTLLWASAALLSVCCAARHRSRLRENTGSPVGGFLQ